MRANAIDKSKLAKTGQEFRDLAASDADWIVRSAEDLMQFRAAGDNAHSRVAERDYQAFVDGLEFRNGGVVTGSYRPLMASLTISEIFDVFESFGMDRGLALETQEAKCVGSTCEFSFWSFCSSLCS
jgi:hypothetical protein